MHPGNDIRQTPVPAFFFFFFGLESNYASMHRQAGCNQLYMPSTDCLIDRGCPWLLFLLGETQVVDESDFTMVDKITTQCDPHQSALCFQS